jgi:ABC-type Fe3+ transport system permease subunit
MIIPYLFHVLVHTAPPLDFTAPHVVTAHVVRRVAMGSYGIEASVEGVVQELRVQH